MDAKTGCAARGWPATCAVAGIVAAAFVPGCVKESHPGAGHPEERASVNRPRTPDLYVHIEDGAVTVHARDAPLENVLDKIAEHGGLQLVVQGRIEERVTAELHSLPLSAALRELLRDRSFVLMDAQEIKSAGESGGGTLWILSSSPSQSAASASVTSRTREHESNTPEESNSVEELTAALADDNPNVRMDAVSALVDFDDEQVAVMLANTAVQDAQPSVRAEALYAMAGRRADAKNLAFARALTDADRDVRKAAIGTLERIGGEDSVRTLAIALKDRDASVRSTAVDALGEIGGDAVRPLLELALKDDSELVREAAAAQLEQAPSG